MVVLKGKRASIGKADLAERNASRCARQVDSVASHRTIDKSDHYTHDTVGIYKPPKYHLVAMGHSRCARTRAQGEILFEEIVDWAMGNSLRSVPVAQSP